jgi:hypothetical protein
MRLSGEQVGTGTLNLSVCNHRRLIAERLFVQVVGFSHPEE